MTRRRFVEYGYAVVLLSLLTLGIVRWFWTERFAAGTSAVDRAVDVTFVLLQLPALVLLLRRHDRRVRTVEWALLGLVGWMGLSAIWSAVPRFTGVAAVMLVLTCCAGAYLARSFSWRELTALVFVAMQPGLLISRVAIERGWPGAVDPFHGTTGIYGNRNLLGPPAVFAAACGVVLIAVVLAAPWRRQVRAATVAGISVVVLFDLDLQRQGGSVTSWLMLVAFFATLAVMAVLQRLPAMTWRPGLGALAARTLLGAFALLFVLALALNEPASRALGRNPGFSGRTKYWSADLSGFMDRPFVGWGWMAAWRDEEFRVTLPDEIDFDVFTHSTYFDIALGGGVVAVVLFLVVAFLGAGTAGSVLDRTDIATAIPTALVVAIALGATQESFFMGNYFLTALLVAAFTAPATTRSTAATRPARPAVTSRT